tara:strand:- start:1 stop:393 length:393 start_codon:yes stop_codon:yes gene_type:complete
MGAKIRKKKSKTANKANKANKAKNKGFQSSAYPKAEYIDTRGTFDKDFKKSKENKTGIVWYRTVKGNVSAKYGDKNFAQSLFLSGERSFRGGTWDLGKRNFTPGTQSYTAIRSLDRKGNVLYSLSPVSEV